MNFLLKTALGIFLSTFLFSCGKAYEPLLGAQKDAAITNNETITDCAAIEDLDAVLSEQAPPLIIIGEVHGRTGAPALVKALLCHSVSRGLKTHLALELPKDRENHALSFIRSDGGGGAYQSFLSDSRWLSLGDGRRTVETFGLLEYLRAERAAHIAELRGQLKIGLSYFAPSAQQIKNLAGDKQTAQSYEIILKDHLNTALEVHRPAKMIVLAGNLHASRDDVTFGGESYKTMASYFGADEALTLNIHPELRPVMTLNIVTDSEARYDGTYSVVTDEMAQAVPSPFR